MPMSMQSSPQVTIEQQRFDAIIALVSGLAGSGDFTFGSPLHGCPNSVDSERLVNAALEVLAKIEEKLL